MVREDIETVDIRRKLRGEQSSEDKMERAREMKEICA